VSELEDARCSVFVAILISTFCQAASTVLPPKSEIIPESECLRVSIRLRQISCTRTIPQTIRRTAASQRRDLDRGMTRFCRCSNEFCRNLNNCQMPRGASGSFGRQQPLQLLRLLSATPLSLSLSLSLRRGLPLSRHFKINLSFARARSHSATAPLYSLQFGL